MSHPYEALSHAMAIAAPACAGDDRFIADAYTHAELEQLAPICRGCPILAACTAYVQAETPLAGYWAGRDFSTRKLGRPRKSRQAASAAGSR